MASSPITNITLSPQNITLEPNQTSASFAISGGSPVEYVRLEASTGDSLGGKRGTDTGTIISDTNAEDWPTNPGDLINFEVEVMRPQSQGGSGAYIRTGIFGSILNPDGDTGNYGIEVRGPNGTSVVFSPSHRFSNTSGAVASSLSGQGTTNITVPGASGTSSYVVFVLKDSERRAQITKFSTFYRVKNTASSGTSVITTLGVLIG